jgi:hypothetical protein
MPKKILGASERISTGTRGSGDRRDRVTGSIQARWTREAKAKGSKTIGRTMSVENDGHKGRRDVRVAHAVISSDRIDLFYSLETFGVKTIGRMA